MFMHCFKSMSMSFYLVNWQNFRLEEKNIVFESFVQKPRIYIQEATVFIRRIVYIVVSIYVIFKWIWQHMMSFLFVHICIFTTKHVILTSHPHTLLTTNSHHTQHPNNENNPIYLITDHHTSHYFTHHHHHPPLSICITKLFYSSVRWMGRTECSGRTGIWP